MAATAALLSVEDLHVRRGDSMILRGISLGLAAGEVVAVLGPNGAGKTTLLNAICGPLRAHQGRITCRGCDVTGLATPAVVALGIAHVAERHQVFGPLSVEDNLILGVYTRRHAVTRDGLRDELERVYKIFPALRERRRDAARLLSGGQQQMLAIGRGLMARPSILLLDEPSLGLAPKVVEEIYGVIFRLVQQHGTGVLLVEQNARAALAISERAYVLERGQIVLSGPSDEMAKSEQLSRAYFGMTAHRPARNNAYTAQEQRANQKG